MNVNHTQVDFYDEKLLDKMLRSLGFRLSSKRVLSSFELETTGKKLDHLRAYSLSPQGYVSYWKTKKQLFDGLCTLIDGFSFVGVMSDDNNVKHPFLKNPFKGACCQEEIELKLLLLGESSKPKI